MDANAIFLHLKKKENKVYYPAKHQGKCLEPYIVVKNNGAVGVYGTTKQEYELLIYYPIDRQSKMEGYVGDIKTQMNELYPGVKLADDQQPYYTDTDKEAVMTSLIYRTAKVNNINRI